MRITIFLFLLFSFVFVNAQNPLLPTSAKDRMDGELRRKQLEEKSLVGKIAFKNIGPTITSGRVVDLQEARCIRRICWTEE